MEPLPQTQNDVALDPGLPIPPLDPNFNLDLFPPDDNDFDFNNFDFDFTHDDLDFADNLLLLEPQSDPNSEPLPSDSSPGRVSPETLHPSSDHSDIIINNNNQINDDVEVRVYDSGPISSSESNYGAKVRCDSPEIGTHSGVYSENNSSDSGNDAKKCMSKRKKEEFEDEIGRNHGDDVEEIRSSKFRRSAAVANEGNVEGGSCFSVGDDTDEKRKARLMRNRESAQLSRQRKKQYVEELEDKVKAMNSTISELNRQISCVMAHNAALQQQLSGGAVPAQQHGPPPVYPYQNGMYHPMQYNPWMPYAPYMVKPQGSQVPLVPIPRLKQSQQPAPAPKVKRAAVEKEKEKEEGKDNKKNKKAKTTKKVASVSLLGLLFFLVLFGGLVPIINVKYGGPRDGFGGVQKGAVFGVERHGGRVLQQVNGTGTERGNGSTEALVASLYVPRNDKMVKIDGNLIIHSILASEKAVAKEEGGGKGKEETSLAIHESYPPYPTPGPGSNSWRRPHLDRNNQNGRQRALGSGNSDEFTPVGTDGKLQQWFREGLAGPMLSSGMCTEVFQFDVSPTPGSIVPASSIPNVTSEGRQNSTRHTPKNRRILHGHAIPLNDHTLNFTEEHVQPHEQNDGLQSNKSSSPMVVSVLVDPREVGDVDGEGVIRSKTLSRIFVVVLIDSVKYVTYSCMLPFMGSGSHLVTT